MALPSYEQDRVAAAEYIAGFLPELSRLAQTAGHDVLNYLLYMAQTEAEELCRRGKSNLREELKVDQEAQASSSAIRATR